MTQRIEGLFLKSTNLNHSSLIIDLFTKQYGRASFIFKEVQKK